MNNVQSTVKMIKGVSEEYFEFTSHLKIIWIMQSFSFEWRVKEVLVSGFLWPIKSATMSHIYEVMAHQSLTQSMFICHHSLQFEIFFQMLFFNFRWIDYFRGVDNISFDQLTVFINQSENNTNSKKEQNWNYR